MVPTIEARFAIPYGILQNQLNPGLTFLFAILGTFLATIIVLAFLYLVVPKIKWKWLNKLMNKVFEHTRKKHSKKLESFKEATIITFVAVPFPGTGIYSGSVICYLMGVPPKKALLLNTIGMLISATITLLGAIGIIAVI
jgi:uncharacterized membrane protein